MEHTFTPGICVDEPERPAEGDEPAKPAAAARYAGTVTIRMPTYDERMEIYDESGVSLGEGGSEKESKDDPPEEKERKRRANLRMARFLGKRAKLHFIRCEITRKADGFKFTTWEQLEHDSDMAGLISEIGSKLVGKFEVGHPSSPS